MTSQRVASARNESKPCGMYEMFRNHFGDWLLQSALPPHCVDGVGFGGVQMEVNLFSMKEIKIPLKTGVIML